MDSSTPAVTAGLVRVLDAGVVLVAEQVTVDARAHGELLAPHIEAVLAAAGATIGDLGAVVAGVGPGPFTSLRVGLVTAATFAQVAAVPTYGVCSLDALGRMVAADAPTGPFLIATDARRREVYWAVYAPDGTPLTSPDVAAPGDVLPALAAHGVRLAAGEGAQKYAETLAVPVAATGVYPSVVALAELAAQRVRAGAATEVLTPLYLRRPDAVASTSRKSVVQG